MDIFNTIKEDYRTLRNGKPGERFRDFVDKRRERRGSELSVGRVVTFVGGVALIVTGLGVGWLPGPGGFIGIIGLALIAQEVPFIADVLDYIERLLRSIIDPVRRRLTSRDPYRPDQ